ncbi:MAG: ferrochelatase [Chlamydiales bacterium]|nr:ferrochelatase [Chlamydiia bacterium]MCP5508270.1 ferrochelatase [Chlamydiales bacterium]
MGKTAVILINLGTPDSPDPGDVHRYLIEFLTDGRVIDIPWLSRQALVRSIIVPKRYRESAKSYADIWMEAGSPLMVYGIRVCEMLQTALGNHYQVELAMRYQNPTIASVLEKVRGCEKIIIVPLFPQYASATTGSVHQKVMELISHWTTIPEIRFISSYPTQPEMIRAFCRQSEKYTINDYDHILFSFHGLPERQIRKADSSGCCLKKGCCERLCEKNQYCYSAQCHATARAIAEELGISKYSLCFQSRLGNDPWLRPYASEVISKLAESGAKKLLVFCPAFVCDCLETIYEIGVEYRDEFINKGGETLDLVPGLNDHPEWIAGLKELVTNDRIPALTRR